MNESQFFINTKLIQICFFRLIFRIFSFFLFFLAPRPVSHTEQDSAYVQMETSNCTVSYELRPGCTGLLSSQVFENPQGIHTVCDYADFHATHSSD